MFEWQSVSNTKCCECGISAKGFLCGPEPEPVGPFFTYCAAAYVLKQLDAGKVTAREFITSLSPEERAKALQRGDLYDALVEGLTKEQIAAAGLVKPDELV